jgi:hypothetical protein
VPWPSSRPSPNKANHNACNQKHGAKHSTDEIEIVTRTVWQAPPHAGKYVELFGDVDEHHDQETNEGQ